MAIFLGVHKLKPGMTDQDTREGFAKYKQNAQELGINPMSAVFNTEKGFAYCQTEADSTDQVREAHQKAGIPLEDVIEVEKVV